MVICGVARRAVLVVQLLAVLVVSIYTVTKAAPVCLPEATLRASEKTNLPRTGIEPRMSDQKTSPLLLRDS